MIYFDHASTSFPKNKEVLNALLYASENFTSSARGSYPQSLTSSKIIFKVRQKVCDFVGCPDGICVFTSGSTAGLNMIIQGFFNPGDHIISTVLEHNSVLRPLYQIQKNGIDIDFANCDDDGIITIDNIDVLRKKNTKAIIITMVSNVLGTLQQIKKIADYAHQHNIIMIVDGAQAIGNIDVSMNQLGIDILVFSGHKGLATPIGIGAIVMNHTYSIRPLLLGGSGFHSFDKTQPEQLPEHLEAGSQPAELIYALAKAIEFQSPKKYQYIASMCNYFIEKITPIKGINILGKDQVGIVTINCQGYTSQEVSDYLYNQKEICIRAGIHCAPLVHQRFKTENKGLVRFSFSIQNNKKEIDEAINTLYQLMEKTR